jgi:hypothetical protein
MSARDPAAQRKRASQRKPKPVAPPLLSLTPSPPPDPDALDTDPAPEPPAAPTKRAPRKPKPVAAPPPTTDPEPEPPAAAPAAPQAPPPPPPPRRWQEHVGAAVVYVALAVLIGVGAMVAACAYKTLGTTDTVEGCMDDSGALMRGTTMLLATLVVVPAALVALWLACRCVAPPVPQKVE